MSRLSLGSGHGCGHGPQGFVSTGVWWGLSLVGHAIASLQVFCAWFSHIYHSFPLLIWHKNLSSDTTSGWKEENSSSPTVVSQQPPYKWKRESDARAFIHLSLIHLFSNFLLTFSMSVVCPFRTLASLPPDSLVFPLLTWTLCPLLQHVTWVLSHGETLLG